MQTAGLLLAAAAPGIPKWIAGYRWLEGNRAREIERADALGAFYSERNSVTIRWSVTGSEAAVSNLPGERKERGDKVFTRGDYEVCSARS